MILDIMAIPLSRGLLALVDGEDHEWLNQWKWWALKVKNKYYAVRTQWLKVEKRYITILMHRQIMNTPKGMETDHISRCCLDNRKSNLRVCTSSENHRNTTGKVNKTSTYKGVCWNKKHKQWCANITHNKKTYYLGHFSNEAKAAKAYDKKAKELFGEFACLNFGE